MLQFDTNKPLDVTGIGNAILDILSFMDDAFIHGQQMTKGDMMLIDEARAGELYALMGPTKEVSGGSVANSMAGLASLGGRAGFIGRVRDDQFGTLYRHDLTSLGVTFATPATTSGPGTGVSYIIVTPDGERTMNTFLGAGSQIAPEDMDAALIGQSKIVFCEGYQWNGETNIAAIRRAFELAHASGAKTAFSTSAVFCVEQHRDAFIDVIGSSVDILFTNEAEAQSLYPGESIEHIAEKLGAMTQLTAITLSEHGSLLVSGDEMLRIAPIPVEKLVDATGAGDLYAAGLLYGLCRGLSLEEAGQLASRCASHIIQQLGARSQESLSEIALRGD